MLAEGTVAEQLYREAIERLSRTRIRIAVARAQLLYGEWLRRENRRVDAREHLRVAHEMFGAMGNEPYADRARRELLATGETVRKRTVETLDELTPQESQIGRMAADGYTNPEIGAQLFLSPRTVEWHLRKVFTKLGISSRRQLRSALPDASAAAVPV
jgi:DNA-binding CsgD family transcriptional regulator